MTPADFDFLAKFLYDKAGLVLGPDKNYLVESRLAPVARRLNVAGIGALVLKLRAGDAATVRDVTDAMMTNESFFFRDTKPFEQFRQVVLPRLLQSRAATRKIRIWSAAASTGQEPYTLAMIVKEEAARLQGWHVDILGTDLSTEALGRAQSGIYTQFEVQRGLPIQLLVKYFKQDGDKWQISPDLRAMVRYRQFNLKHDPRTLGTFDVVFCRNVLIYFDPGTKADVLGRIATVMTPDGLLYLGGAETVVGITDRFVPMPNQRGIYTLGPASAAAVPLRQAAGA